MLSLLWLGWFEVALHYLHDHSCTWLLPVAYTMHRWKENLHQSGMPQKYLIHSHEKASRLLCFAEFCKASSYLAFRIQWPAKTFVNTKRPLISCVNTQSVLFSSFPLYKLSTGHLLYTLVFTRTMAHFSVLGLFAFAEIRRQVSLKRSGPFKTILLLCLRSGLTPAVCWILCLLLSRPHNKPRVDVWKMLLCI